MFRHYSTLNFPYLATKEHNLSVLLMNMLRMLRTPIGNKEYTFENTLG